MTETQVALMSACFEAFVLHIHHRAAWRAEIIGRATVASRLR